MERSAASDESSALAYSSALAKPRQLSGESHDAAANAATFALVASSRMTTGGRLRADERPAPAVPEAFCDVFLSYARRDLKFAEPLRAALVREGLSVWVDQSGIQAAAPWREEIASALASGTAVAQCWLQLVVASLSEATPVARIPLPDGFRATTLTGDARMLVATDAEGCLLGVSLDPAAWAALARRKAGHEATDEERRRFLPEAAHG
jgi:hypothetical protein